MSSWVEAYDSRGNKATVAKISVAPHRTTVHTSSSRATSLHEHDREHHLLGDDLQCAEIMRVQEQDR